MGLALVFIAHDLAIVRRLCDRVAVMYRGRIVEDGPTPALFGSPRHPLHVRADPGDSGNRPGRPLPDRPLAGDPPRPARSTGGCSFARAARSHGAVPDESAASQPAGGRATLDLRARAGTVEKELQPRGPDHEAELFEADRRQRDGDPRLRKRHCRSRRRADHRAPGKTAPPSIRSRPPRTSTSGVFSNVYDVLVRVDRTGTKLEPGLAESWEVSDDGLTYTFKIRDAKFSDGSPITARTRPTR